MADYPSAMRLYQATCDDGCGAFGPQRTRAGWAQRDADTHDCLNYRADQRPIRRVVDDPDGLMRMAHYAARPWLRGIPDDVEVLSDAMLGVAQAAVRWRPDGGATLLSLCLTRARYAIIDGKRDRGVLTRDEHPAGVHVDDLPSQRRGALPMSSFVNGDGETVVIDLADPLSTAPYDAAEARVDLAPLLDTLTDRERWVVTQVHLLDRKQRDVAADLGVTECRVSQLLVTAMKRMRAAATPTG